MNDITQHILVEKHITNLSLAILPKDHYSPKTYPLGRIDILLKDLKIKTIKNYSGYYLYMDIEDGDYTVQIESDFYLKKEFKITIPAYGSPPGGEIFYDDEEVRLWDFNGALLAEVTLMPDASYPFDTGATLIRGGVIDSSGKPISEATVIAELLNKDIKNRTNQQGQFVLYIIGIREEEIIKKEVNGKKRYIKGKNDDEIITLEAYHEDLGISPPIQLTVEEGTVASTFISF